MADENKSKDVLVHADHVKVYFKGKDKKSDSVAPSSSCWKLIV